MIYCQPSGKRSLALFASRDSVTGCWGRQNSRCFLCFSVPKLRLLGFVEMRRLFYLLNSFLKLAQISVKFQRDVVEVINVIAESGAHDLSRKQFLCTHNTVSVKTKLSRNYLTLVTLNILER